MLSNFQQPEQTALIIENLRIKQQWLEDDNGFKKRKWKSVKGKSAIWKERQNLFPDH